MTTSAAEKFRPLSDRLLVKPVVAPEKVGLIILPDAARDSMRPNYGRVVAMGPGVRKKGGGMLMIDVKLQDLVVYGEYSGSVVEFDGVEHLIMRSDDVKAVLEELEEEAAPAAQAS
jgi:chaperonin GroES